MAALDGRGRRHPRPRRRRRHGGRVDAADPLSGRTDPSAALGRQLPARLLAAAGNDSFPFCLFVCFCAALLET